MSRKWLGATDCCVAWGGAGKVCHALGGYRRVLDLRRCGARAAGDGDPGTRSEGDVESVLGPLKVARVERQVQLDLVRVER